MGTLKYADKIVTYGGLVVIWNPPTSLGGAMTPHVGVDGEWLPCQVYVGVDDEWLPCQVYVGVDGEWIGHEPVEEP